MKKSITQNHLLSSLGFGIVMGLVFPFYSMLFISSFKTSGLMIIYFVSCIFAGIIVGTVSFMIGKIAFNEFFKKMSNSFALLAQGNLDSSVELISEDIIGKTVTDFNGIVDHITRIILSAQGTTDFVANFFEKIEETMNDYLRYTGECLAEIKQLNDFMKILIDETGTIRDWTAQEFEIVMALVNRISNLSITINDTSSSIEKAQELIRHTTTLHESGQNAVDAMQHSMNVIEKRSGEVRGIVRIIRDISEQINLLSLNAAIESARAGESGRGFAVVADEISKLADMTATSVMDIERLIIENEREIGQGLNNFTITVSSISEIMQEISSINSIVSTIYDSMQIQISQNYEVTRESETVRKVSNNIKDTIIEHNLTVSHASVELEQIFSQFQALQNKADSISSNLSITKREVEKLVEIINFFSL